MKDIVDGKHKSEEENERKNYLLETKFEEQSQRIIMLEQRIVSLEIERHRFSRTPSFLTGDPIY